jgi:hypothetical protein
MNLKLNFCHNSSALHHSDCPYSDLKVASAGAVKLLLDYMNEQNESSSPLNLLPNKNSSQERIAIIPFGAQEFNLP